MISRREFLQGASGIFALGVAGAVYTVVIEPRFRLTVAQWTVEHADWPSDAPPLRIAIITDVHAVEPWMPASRIARIAEAANQLKPDLTVLLGDYVSGLRNSFKTNVVPISAWSAALQPLKAPLGVHAVLGNHDWWEDAEAVRKGLEAQGIPVMENDVVKLKHEGQPFWLAGLGDQAAFRITGGYRGVDDLPGTVAKLGNDNDPAILLAHEPDIFPEVPERFALTLSGHTHGGQINLPFYGPPLVPSKYGKRFAYGHIIEGNRHLVVSAGLGVSILPVRFMAPPEIAVVTLRGRPQAG